MLLLKKIKQVTFKELLKQVLLLEAEILLTIYYEDAIATCEIKDCVEPKQLLYLNLINLIN
jgi:hypothetical protein